METTPRTDPDRRLRRQLRQRIEWGRWGILGIMAITLINQILLLCGEGYHFLFSAAIPYYLNWLAIQLDITAFKAVATILTLLLYVAYAACWLLSGRQREWMMAALGLYGVDTILLIIFALTLLENPTSCLLEVLVHCLCMVLLFFAYRAAEQLSRMPRRRRPSAPPPQ